MTGSEKVFFDTTPFIYLLENHPTFYLPVAEFVKYSLASKQATLVTSVVSFAEYSVKPKKAGKPELIGHFENLIRDLNFQISDINYTIAEVSSSLRAKYSFLKTIDSLQVSAAIHSNCAEFFTNDKALKPIQEIRIVLVEEWLNVK